MSAVAKEDYFERLRQEGLEAAWPIFQRLVPSESTTSAVPFLWK